MTPQSRRNDDERRDEKRMRAAREVARWKLGDPNWADTILNAYWNPIEATTKLREEENR